MCTVITIPTKNGMYFCSVRDESSKRKAAAYPTIFNKNSKNIICPLDSEKGGTWIGVTAASQMIVLLNGGFENHLPNHQEFRKSRGLIVKEILESNHFFETWEKLNLSNIEPFTLLVYEAEMRKSLVWDGISKFETTLTENEAKIFSSSTLYDAAAKRIRQNAFDLWLKSTNTDNIQVFDLLKSISDNENGFLIDRSNSLKSLSVSIVKIEEHTATFIYHDLEKKKVLENQITLN